MPQITLRRGGQTPSGGRRVDTGASGTVLSRLMKAFKTGDDDGFSEAYAELAEQGGRRGRRTRDDDEGNMPEVLIINSPPGSNGGDDGESGLEEIELEPNANKTLDAISKAIGKAMKPVTDSISDFGKRLEKLEGKKPTGDKDDDDDLEDKDGDSDEEKARKKKAREARNERTGDSKALETSFRDTIARGEILSPGISLPTFDAKATRAVTIDSMCSFRRNALTAFGKTADGAKILLPLLSGQAVDKLTCDAVAMAFGAASSAKLTQNNKSASGKTADSGETRRGPPSPREMNEASRKFYEKKGGV